MPATPAIYQLFINSFVFSRDHTSQCNRNAMHSQIAACDSNASFFPKEISWHVFFLFFRSQHIQFKRLLHSIDNDHFNRNGYNEHYKWNEKKKKHISSKLLVCYCSSLNQNFYEWWHFHCRYCRHCLFRLFAWKTKLSLIVCWVFF